MANAVGTLLFVMFIPLQLMGCSPTQNDANGTNDIPPDVYSNSSAETYLEPSEREIIEAKALEGDKEALDAIIDHYSLGSKVPNIDRLIYWLRIAYQSGDEKRLYDLIYLAGDSNLNCAEIVSLYGALEKLDPEAAKARRMGKVAGCLDDRP